MQIYGWLVDLCFFPIRLDLDLNLMSKVSFPCLTLFKLSSACQLFAFVKSFSAHLWSSAAHLINVLFNKKLKKSHSSRRIQWRFSPSINDQKTCCDKSRMFDLTVPKIYLLIDGTFSLFMSSHIIFWKTNDIVNSKNEWNLIPVCPNLCENPLRILNFGKKDFSSFACVCQIRTPDRSTL